jgi:ABC-2 type transport system permease protein
MSTAIANIKTITKRELGVYFSSPLAYVFLIIFLLLIAVFTFFVDAGFGPFFEHGQASLVTFFVWHPWFYMFLVPAVAMRLWAEERRSGTIELLLTMPVSPWQAIVGKFLASWLFLGIALVLTFPIFITVNYLGAPDNGVIIACYCGSWLMAGAYLAVSCITSAMTRSQVISFIVSVVICLLLILVGLPSIIHLLSQCLSPGLVGIAASFGFLTHFFDFQKGILDVRDVIFFLSIIIFSLFTTSVILRSHRAG